MNSLGFDLQTLSYPMPKDYNNQMLLDKIWDVYCDYSGPQLSTLTHQKDTPWDIVWNKLGGKNKKGTLIPNGLIEDHYKQKLSQPAN